ncbi:hypothetical protein CO151_12035 [bacterium CG_4_9_14_3_um_filter_65_15]|nr:MAG: hypothetical protein CO151_12035 [bacterium CG_4_9_14_3_um_filter_65_15]
MARWFPSASRKRFLRRPSGVAAPLALGLLVVLSVAAVADVVTPVPPDQRGQLDAERSGQHDANNMRTVFWNYGMVGDYPRDPGNVDLSVFHSVEVPKGSGMNYSDGVTPFVLAKVTQADGLDAYIMETGFRERQGTSPYYNRVMRFEPRPGYFQPDPGLNPGRSPALSNDPRTWPDFWPDRLDEPSDPGWPGSWNGYFGKQVVADQESYVVLDDNFYDAWPFYPDSRDSTRRGLGLRIEVRGFQWANPQARNVIFWHYDITNEGTTDYDDNIIFGLYMDSGVGGSALSCDGIFESDDDNAFYQDEFNGQRINLVYTWDNGGHGRDLTGSCATTGYLGYAYMETPGNPTDGLDNDLDGITDERRDGGEGTLLIGEDQILSYVAANYDQARFEAVYGPVTETPAYRAGLWWTGDEDMDWTVEGHDVGADGLAETGDIGEGDGIPTAGEPNFDGTDLNESDQIGLTGFKLNRIRPGQGNPNQETDGIVFFTDNHDWPERLYNQFSSPDSTTRFDPPLASNYNIGFLFASGPFRLAAGQTERFSLALAYGASLEDLSRNTQTVQQIYNANYRFAVPPPAPTATAETGDGWVRLSWDDVAERGADPVTGEYDFEGYRIYRSTDPDFRDPQVISTGTGSGPLGNGKPIAQFDRIDGQSGFSELTIEGVAYYLGTETGLTHTWTDYSVTNGQQYYYAVTAYDFGSTDPKFNFYPSENAIAPSRTPRGGLVLPSNVVAVRPDPRVLGFVAATAEEADQAGGRGSGSVAIEVVNSNEVPDGHDFQVSFAVPHPDSLRASHYLLTDLTTGEILFEEGKDLIGQGIGPVGEGLLPVVETPAQVAVDTAGTGFREGSSTDATLVLSYQKVLSINQPRPGFPDDLTLEFFDSIVDTSLGGFPFVETPARFKVIAHSEDGDRQLDFRFRDRDGDYTLSGSNELIDVVTYLEDDPATPYVTWRLQLDPNAEAPTVLPGSGDVFEARLVRPFSSDDVFTFSTHGAYVDPSAAKGKLEPYVVPNPYMASAGFEPERFAVSGRGVRRIEFRGLPARCTIRIYNLLGELVQTLQHDGSDDGFVAWDLRTKDQLDVAPGLYIFHVDGGETGTATGKFAIVK